MEEQKIIDAASHVLGTERIEQALNERGIKVPELAVKIAHEIINYNHLKISRRNKKIANSKKSTIALSKETGLDPTTIRLIRRNANG